jgi:hypothetical protein
LIATCPYINCNKVIFRKMVAVVKVDTPHVFDFMTICPHCSNGVKVNISFNIQTKAVEL